MRQEDTKRKILEQALRLFSVNGYAAVSVEQIAQAVGIRAPSLYKHYKSKRDIFAQIVAEMERQDAAFAAACGVPGVPVQEAPQAYAHVPMDSIRAFSTALFRHWTEDAFAAGFRRLLTLEQYRDLEMAGLYRQYLSAGPLAYMEDIFAPPAGGAAAGMALALAFYGPMFLLYSVYDDAADKAAVLPLLEAHIDRFAARLAAQEKDL